MPDRLAATLRNAAAEMDRIGHFRALELPGMALSQPGLGGLDLRSIVEVLLEQALFVADAIAVRRDRQRCEAVHETRGKPSQPAVSQRGVRLVSDHGGIVLTQRLHRLSCHSFDAEVHGHVLDQPTDQELH